MDAPDDVNVWADRAEAEAAVAEIVAAIRPQSQGDGTSYTVAAVLATPVVDGWRRDAETLAKVREIVRASAEDDDWEDDTFRRIAALCPIPTSAADLLAGGS